MLILSRLLLTVLYYRLKVGGQSFLFYKPHVTELFFLFLLFRISKKSNFISDDKPAVVITHGDILSREERARVQVLVGELLGIPPDKQIFDIPGLYFSFETATYLIG